MRVPLMIYKNNPLANVASVFGTILCLIGFAMIRSEANTAVVLLLIGIGLIIAARLLAEHVRKQKIQQLLNDPELIDVITHSALNAFELYRKIPEEYTLEHIRKYNPFAADKISQIVNDKGMTEQAVREMQMYDIQQQRTTQ